MIGYEWFIFPALAAVVVGIAYFSNRSSWQSCISLRLEGIRINRLIKQLLLDLQQHRGMVNAFLSGDNSFKPKIEQKQTAIGKDIAALDACCSQGLITVKRWENTRSAWQTLRMAALTLPAEESFRRHSELIRDVLYSMGDVAERSYITGKCATDSALVSALWTKLPAVAEGLGQARGVGSSVAAKGYCSSIARVKLRFLEERVSETIGWVNDDLAHADRTQAASFAQAWSETHSAVQEFLALLEEKLINAEHPAINAEHYFNAGTKALDAVFHAFDQASSALENALTGAGAARNFIPKSSY